MAPRTITIPLEFEVGGRPLGERLDAIEAALAELNRRLAPRTPETGPR